MRFYKKDYDDSEVREFGIKFMGDKFNLQLESHPNNKEIDLIDPNDYSFGVELEKGGWSGDFWLNHYSTVSCLEFRTINVPIRKQKYWYSFDNKKWIPNNSKHLFVRTNKVYTQVIMIRPETFRDENKVIFTEFMPNNSKELEKWMSFKEGDVETYDLKDGNWEIRKNEL